MVDQLVLMLVLLILGLERSLCAFLCSFNFSFTCWWRFLFGAVVHTWRGWGLWHAAGAGSGAGAGWSVEDESVLPQ